MKDIIIEKLVLNISTGQSGDRLTFATRVLEQLTQQKPCLGRARYTVRQFNIRRNETISAFVTVRGEKAKDLISRGLKVKELELKKDNFASNGASSDRRRCGAGTAAASSGAPRRRAAVAHERHGTAAVAPRSLRRQLCARCIPPCSRHSPVYLASPRFPPRSRNNRCR